MIVEKIFIVSAVILLATALPFNDSPDLLSYRSLMTDDGGYDFGYSTADQSRDEQGNILLLKEGDKEVQVLEVRGYYTFIGDDNRNYRVDYVAGVNGYRAITTITDGGSQQPLSTPAPDFQIDPSALKSLVG